MIMKQEITDLTIARAIFAAWVFIYHVDLYLNFSAWLGPFAGLIRHGYMGVDGFFILSGLILARVHPELGASLRAQWGAVKFRPPAFRLVLAFWGKRLARIYPVHLATLFILGLLVAGGIMHGVVPRDPGRFGLPALVQNLFLVQGWGDASQGAWNYPSWSVSAEWAGYLLFPVLWYLLSYMIDYVAIQILIVAFAVMVLITLLHHGSYNLTFSLGLVRFFPEFIIGICSARFVALCADMAALRRAALWGGVGFWFIGAATGVDGLALLGIWLVLFAFLMQADTQLPPVLGQRPLLHRFGLLSYSFYMSFAVAELVTCQWFRHQGWTPASHGGLFALLMLGLTLALALLLHMGVELPARRLAGRWLASPPPPVHAKAG